MTIVLIMTAVAALGSLASSQEVVPTPLPLELNSPSSPARVLEIPPENYDPSLHEENSPRAEPTLVNDDGRTALDKIFRTLALEALPPVYEDLREWNRTKEFVTGLHIERDGLRIDTKRRRRDLRHGTWRKYRVELVNQDEFELRVLHAHRRDDGRIAFDVHVIACFDLHARQSRYRRNLQIYSVSADGYAKVDLLLNCVADIRLDAAHIIPEVVIEPEVTNADIILLDFDLDRISKIGGDVAEELGRSVRGRLSRKLAEKDDKLVSKLNAKFEEEEDKLRLSITKLAASQFADLAKLAKTADAE